MYSLHQEFPEGVSHEGFVARRAETRDLLTATGEKLRARLVLDETRGRVQNDWPAQWLHAKWITDHTKAITGIWEAGDPSPLRMALTRSEEFGGIVYDPFSDKVYRVNEPGLRLFRALQASSKEGGDLKAVCPEGFAAEDVGEFCAFLRGADLWER
jgi:hypothetical protein